MEILRKAPFPIAYTRIPWIRRVVGTRFVDCPEDIPYINNLRAIASGSTCLSNLDYSSYITVKAEIPDCIHDLNGETHNMHEILIYNWKIKDISNLILDIRPTESVWLYEAGLTIDDLIEISSPSTCLPLLEKVISTSNYTHITSEIIDKIKTIERTAINCHEISQLIKCAQVAYRRPGNSRGVSQKERLDILRRDFYKCALCGASENESKLEIDHIIPKAMIRRLELPDELYTAKHNLITTCRECNNAKRDELTTSDVQHYSSKFSNSSHPNHSILKYISGISNLQQIRLKSEDHGDE